VGCELSTYPCEVENASSKSYFLSSQSANKIKGSVIGRVMVNGNV
jgi:hypothetical protein